MNRRQARKLLRRGPRTWRQRDEWLRAERELTRRGSGVPENFYVIACMTEARTLLARLERIVRKAVAA